MAEEKQNSALVYAEEITASDALIDIRKFLNPISEENPAGEYLRYEGTYDRIQEARREDDALLPRGVWERELKKADWHEVKALCESALEHKTKDLQIAVWLMESLMRIHGFEGAEAGLGLVIELCETFWENMYPEIEGDEMESRLSPLYWMNERLPAVLKQIPVTSPSRTENLRSYTFSDWENADLLENQAIKEKGRLEQAELEGKVTRSKFLGSVMFSSTSFYRMQLAPLDSISERAEALDRFLNEKCGRHAPGLNSFRTSVIEIRNLISGFLQEKQKKDEEGGTAPDKQNLAEYSGKEGDRNGSGSPISVRNRADAYRMLNSASDYLLIHEPHSPTPYLVKRAVSWGNMSLTELLHELIADEHDLHQILKLLGLKNALSK